jgi:hypothetical protein
MPQKLHVDPLGHEVVYIILPFTIFGDNPVNFAYAELRAS